MRVTINDIAKHAGVSKTAVSFAFNDPTRISRETYEKIMRIANELGYIPDPVARTLATKRSGTIGFLLPQAIPLALKNPFLSHMLQGIGSVCQHEGFSLTIVPPLKGCIFQGVRSAAVDGFVTLGLETSMKTVQLLRQRHIPFVTIDGEPSEEIPSINTDDMGGAYNIMKYILGLGHRRIAILSLKAAKKIDQEKFSRVRDKRLEGYREALHQFGLSLAPRKVKVIECECSMDGGKKAANKLFSLKKPPTAILTMSDIIALGVHSFCRESGIRIPAELSIAGFDDIPEASIVSPSLTTVSQPGFKKGEKAGEILINLLHDRKVERHVEFKTSIIIRESTAPPDSSQK